MENLGFNSFFKKACNKADAEIAFIARVISEHREAYTLKNADGEYFAKITGKRIFLASTREDFPVVGDWVIFDKIDEGKAVIKEILPRFSILRRKYGDKDRSDQKNDSQIIASNIDVAFVIESVDRDFNLNRFERYFLMVQQGGAKPIAVLNKIDLVEKEILEEIVSQFRSRFPDIELILTSTILSNGIDELKKQISLGKTFCFLGSSGVGKSSLINRLIGRDSIKTGEIGSHSERGKHTTTSRQMYFLENGGILIDNPGIREIGIIATANEIDNFFGDISDLAPKCKYKDCTHTHEPGCRVIEAKDTGTLSEDQYLNYLNIQKETEYSEMNDYEKRKKDRQFGKFLKKAKEDLKKIE